RRGGGLRADQIELCLRGAYRGRYRRDLDPDHGAQGPGRHFGRRLARDREGFPGRTVVPPRYLRARSGSAHAGREGPGARSRPRAHRSPLRCDRQHPDPNGRVKGRVDLYSAILDRLAEGPIRLSQLVAKVAGPDKSAAAVTQAVGLLIHSGQVKMVRPDTETDWEPARPANRFACSRRLRSGRVLAPTCAILDSWQQGSWICGSMPTPLLGPP